MENSVIERVLGSLPNDARKIWESIYEASKKAGDSKEVSAKKAWSGIKRAFEKNEKGEWVKKKSEAFSEFSLTIHKVSVEKSEGGVMRWRAVASDTSPDLYDESMSVELFDDFITRIDKSLPVPSPFDKVLNEDWKGGMPYISISHYKSGTGGKNVPGMPEKIYRDGNRLKAVGVLHDNPLGRAVFRSLCDDLYKKNSKYPDKIRVSIGFLDLAHTHVGEGKTPDYTFERKSLEDTCPMCQSGVGRKVYKKGQLVHLALTRVPVNPRTDMEVTRSMITTKLEDAESIVGKDLVEGLEEKSLLSSYLVTKNDTEATVEEKANLPIGLPGQEAGTGMVAGGNTMTAVGVNELQAHANEGYETEELEGDLQEDADDKIMDARPVAKKAKVASDKQSEELTYEEEDEQKREERRNRPAGERSMLQKSFDELEAKVTELKSQGVPAETALKEIQNHYNALGLEIKKSFEPATATPQNSELAELMGVVKSLAESVTTLQQSMSTEIATLKAQVAGGRVVAKSEVPAPRSIPASLPMNNQPQRKLSQIEELAYRSTLAR